MTDDEMKTLLEHFELTGRASMSLVRQICNIFFKAEGRWEEKYAEDTSRDPCGDKVTRWALLKTVAYILKLNKHGKLSILKNSPPARQLKWRITRFAMQIVAASWKALRKKKRDEDAWLDKRLAKQEAKETAQWVENALR